MISSKIKASKPRILNQLSKWFKVPMGDQEKFLEEFDDHPNTEQMPYRLKNSVFLEYEVSVVMEVCALKGRSGAMDPYFFEDPACIIIARASGVPANMSLYVCVSVSFDEDMNIDDVVPDKSYAFVGPFNEEGRRVVAIPIHCCV